MNTTAVNYHEGTGCEQSYEQAAKWFEMAACQGHVGAQVNLGNLYRLGRGVSKNTERAVELFRRSAAEGNPADALNLWKSSTAWEVRAAFLETNAK